MHIKMSVFEILLHKFSPKNGFVGQLDPYQSGFLYVF